jgi:hypothetical protein
MVRDAASSIVASIGGAPVGIVAASARMSYKLALRNQMSG